VSVELGKKEWLSNLCVMRVNGKLIYIVDLKSEEGLSLYEIRESDDQEP
jgi:hypothetical protein